MNRSGGQASGPLHVHAAPPPPCPTGAERTAVQIMSFPSTRYTFCRRCVERVDWLLTKIRADEDEDFVADHHGLFTTRKHTRMQRLGADHTEKSTDSQLVIGTCNNKQPATHTN
jgi:hypothetical protein